MSEKFWLGPTYEFTSGEWTLTAGIPADEGRLEWLLRRFESGIETVSHSFVLEQHASPKDLALLLGDLPPSVMADLVQQVADQTDPVLLSHGSDAIGLA